ncbi:MAG: hypothetical protein ACK502_00940 [Alphaproteobacteria bacterium]
MLRRIRNGISGELSNDQKNSIRESGALIRLLMNYAEHIGGEGHDGSTSLSAFDKFKADIIYTLTETPIDAVEQKIKGGNAQYARYYAEHLNTYRTSILPLLEELAGVLRITFDKPKGGIG